MTTMMIGDSDNNNVPEHIVTADILPKLPITSLIDLWHGGISKQYSTAAYKLITHTLFGAADDDDDVLSGVLVLVTEKGTSIYTNRYCCCNHVFYLTSSDKINNNDDDDKLELRFSLHPDFAFDTSDMYCSRRIHHDGAQYLGSVNGIIVLRELKVSNEGFMMWNPATNSYKMTRRCSTPDPGFLEHENFGCGICAQSKQLIVVSIRSYTYRYHGRDGQISNLPESQSQIDLLRDLNRQLDYLVEVYSLITDSWRLVEVDAQLFLQFPPGDSFFYPQVGYTGNTFSWLVVCLCDDLAHVITIKLLTFHVTTEVFQVTSLPDAILGGTYDYFISNYERNDQQPSPIQLSNENIALVIPNRERSSFDIWLLLEFGVMDSWTKLCTTGPFPQVREILGFWKNGKVIMESTSGQLLLADLATNKVVQKLSIEGSPGSSTVIPHKDIPFVLKGSPWGAEGSSEGSSGTISLATINQLYNS